MNAYDVTARVLKLLDESGYEGVQRVSETSPDELHPQAAAMFVKMAAHAIHKISLGSIEYEDYSAPVTGLALIYCLVTCERRTSSPSFGNPTRPDAWVRATFARQLMAELNREQAARLRSRIWSCWYDPSSDRFRHRLNRRRRVSALTLLDNFAKPALLQALIGQSLNDLSPDDLYHAMSASPEMLHFLTATDPAGWTRFEVAIGVNAAEMAALVGFLEFLSFAAEKVGHSCWYDDTFLTTLWEIYAQAYPRYVYTSSTTILRAVHEFSLTPSDAARWLLHPPFFILDGKLLRNPCFNHASNLLVGLLTIAIRKHEKAWNDTLGSSLAHAADTLSAMLPSYDRLKVAVRRKHASGDVDLALYDTLTGELLLCEVKTVYDKHRTDSLMHRFEEARVNVARAAAQLRASERAIADRTLTLAHLFEIEPSPPTRVHLALLTWLDPIDLTVATPDEEIHSLNFATFLWLVGRSAGNVQLMACSLRELRNLWPVALTRSLDLGQAELVADLEVQTVLLDRRADLEALRLSELSREIVDCMQSIEDLPSNAERLEWTSYIADTRAALEQDAAS